MTQDILAEINSLTLEAQEAKSSAEAVELYEKAFDKSKQTKDDKIERICALNLGAAHVWNGNPKAGLSALHKAKPPPGGESDGYAHEADLNFNEANAYLKLGNQDEAKTCLGKAFELYEKDNDDNMKKECGRKLANLYCDMATKARLDPQQVKKAEDIADECLKLNLHEIGLQGEECTDACKILNELGLVYTQLQKYDKAVQCFEKAVELCRRSGSKQVEQLMAVLLQNLGAGYNFTGDYQRSIKFHEDAEKKYTKTGVYRIGRNGQGQCYMNLAFAYCQLEGGASDNAFRAFQEAKKAALDTDDRHMLWQAYEGLGAVYFNQGNFTESVENYREALQRITDEEGSKRVVEKLEMALQNKMAKQTGRIFPSYTQRPSSTGPRSGYMVNPVQAQQMQSTLSEVQERQIIPHTQTAEQNMMASVKSTTMVPMVAETKRGKVRMRKQDSIGPHYPKVALGFGNLSHRPSTMTNPETVYMDTPRAKPTTGLDTDTMTEETEESSDSSSDTDDDDSDDTKVDVVADKVDSEKVEEIFRKAPAGPNYMLSSRNATQEETSLKQYADMLEEKEAEEGVEAKNQPEDTEDDTDVTEESSSEDEDNDDDDDDDDKITPKQASLAPPPPAQATPQSALSSKDMGTYINKDLQNSPPHHSYSNVNVNGHSKDSPRAATSDIDPPYATIGTLKRSGDETSAGNAADQTPSKPKQPKLHTEKSGTKKSQNFFVSEDSEEINGGSTGYRSVKMDSHDREEEEGRLENLPRGQREQFLHDEHIKRQQESAESVPPPLPDRKDKQSKTCVIM